MMMKQTRIPALLCAAAVLLSACSPRVQVAESAPWLSETPLRSASEALSVPDVLSEPEKLMKESAGELVELAASYTALDLSFPQTFAITRPTEKLSTTLSSYFITGTSDPGKPVYYGSTEISRQGSKGVFGVLVNLDMGDNTFTFSQGGQSATVTITRTSVSTTVSGLVQSSLYPSAYGSAKAGGELLVECTGPSGAVVTATFGGKTPTLSQVGTASTGQAVTFRGSLSVGDGYEAGVTTKAGKITYTMTYSGSSKSYDSTGNVYIAGSGARLAVEVSGYIGFVTSTDNINYASDYTERLKGGAVDYIESQDNSYYKLSSGGYLSTGAAHILEGANDLGNTVSKVSFTSGSNYESYTFYGTGKPAYLTKSDENSFSLTLYNTTGTPGADVSGSRVFSSVTTTDGGNRVNYTFNKKNTGNLWGYNISYDGKNTVVRIAYKPSVSSGSQPLSGVKIVLDPGHGDHDSGAPGVAGKSGPDENTVNMAHALAAKAMLEEKGATVLLTRSSTGEFLTLDERLEFFENSGADLFLSIHHNSLVESADANSVSGLEVYYHIPLSKNLATKMMSSLVLGLGRKERTLSRDYYRVTMIPYAPSILCELGYMCNPGEYEKLTNQTEVERVAAVFADSVVTALS